MEQNKEQNICIIPARGGSKRIPNKNIKLLNRIPLLLYSINYAKQNLDIIDRIVVSTDDAEIKRIALENHVDVIDRPIEISGDEATTVSALKHVIENQTISYDNVILLQVTNPLRPKTLLKEAYNKFLETNSDSLMSVSRNFNKFGKIIENKFVPFNYVFGQRSQDLEPLYFENGLIYIIKTTLIKEELIMGDNNFPYMVDHAYAKVDIDTDEDLNFAKFILENYQDE